MDGWRVGAYGSVARIGRNEIWADDTAHLVSRPHDIAPIDKRIPDASNQSWRDMEAKVQANFGHDRKGRSLIITDVG